MKILTHLDLTQNELQNAVLQNLATAPENPTVGQVYFNTKDKKAYIYKEKGWEILGLSDVLITKLENIEAGADKVFYGKLPEASAANNNKVVIYTGPATNGLKPGLAYICAEKAGQYSWKEAIPTLVGQTTDSATVTATDGKVSADVNISAASDNAIEVKTQEGEKGLYVKTITAATDNTSGLMTAEQKKKLDGVAKGAQVNVLEGVKVNNVALSIAADKTVNILTPEATTDKAGLMSAADKTKMDGITSGAEPNKIDTITVNDSPVTITKKNAAIKIANATDEAAGLMSKEDKIKLDGVATGATKNSTDAHLLNRANHTGTQSLDTITETDTKKILTADERTKLSGLENYTLPKASADTLGGIKVGKGLAIDSNGVLKATQGGTADAVEWEGVLNKPSTLGKPLSAGGTFTKVTIDTNGLVTKGDNVTADDLPDLSTKYIPVAQKAQNNGVATLDSQGKITFSQLPDSVLGNVRYGGTFDPVTGICTLADGKIVDNEGNVLTELTITTDNATNFKGYYFLASRAGTFNNIDFLPGDWFISNGKRGWEKIDNTDAVVGVKGAKEENYRIGQVSLSAADIGAVEANSNITGGTFTKVTVDAKGLVTKGVDKITTADIKDFATESAKYVKIDQTSSNANKALVTDGNGKVTTAAHKFISTIGDGAATVYTVTHNMNSRDVIVQISDVNTYEVVYADVAISNENAVVVKFNQPPASGAYRILIIA